MGEVTKRSRLAVAAFLEKKRLGFVEEAR